MTDSQIHFELFIRRNVNVGWSLHLASEDRQRCIAAAEELMATSKAVAVRVSKETLDPETREFRSVTVLSKGMVEMVKPKVRRTDDDGPMCAAPSDLYSTIAREKINRLLDPWLKRQKVTAFELLHRPDLVEQLDASGMEIQHAVQKIAIPEAQNRGVSVHEVIRSFQAVIEKAVDRIIKDGRKQNFPKVAPDSFGKVLESFQDHPERSYMIGAGIARHIGEAKDWTGKISRLMDLADAAPSVGKPRALAYYMLEQPLSEILGSRGGLSEILGGDQDLGGNLGSLIRLGANDSVELMAGLDPNIARLLPPLSGEAARLCNHLSSDAFAPVRAALIRRVVSELKGPRRLRPADPAGEIVLLRALAMCLTATAGKLVTLDDVQEAFGVRSKAMVSSEFVGDYLSTCRTALAEAQALARLADNVTGVANKREAAKWIASCVGALKFEREMREGPDSPLVKLSVLADLQRAVSRAGLADADQAPCLSKIGEIGGLVEGHAKLAQALTKSSLPPVQKLIQLLRMSVGETAPRGPAADRAKIEAVKMLRQPELRPALAGAPEQFAKVRELLGTLGIAA
jgi:hypothetical protein